MQRAMELPDFRALAEKVRLPAGKPLTKVRLLDYARWPLGVLRGAMPIFRLPPGAVLARLGHVWPISRLPRRALITRYDDVMEVLSRDHDFPVPFETGFRKLDRTGENFILGMEHDDTYRAIHAEAMRIFRRSDLTRITEFSADRAEALVAGGNGEIDCIADLCNQVMVDIVGYYFGIPSDHPDFALWLIAMSSAAFPVPGSGPDVEPAGLAAADHLGPLVDRAIRRAKGAGADDRTILGRFVTAQRTSPNVLTDDVLRATIMGFMLGFIPTNNRASGQIIEWLLRHPADLRTAVDAARGNDDDLLGRVLFEALRFNPIDPWRERRCRADTRIAAGTPRETTIYAGTRVFASTLAASFDPRRVPNPSRYDPSRSIADAMTFGWGQHWCVGFAIALAQITQTFKPLLRRGGLQRAPGPRGRPAYYGVFFEHLLVTYTP